MGGVGRGSIIISGSTIGLLSWKKAQLHHQVSDDNREEESDAGKSDCSAGFRALVHAFVAGAGGFPLARRDTVCLQGGR